MSSFTLTAETNPSWPFAADFRHKANHWLTVSSRHGKQIPINKGFVEKNADPSHLKQTYISHISMGVDFLYIEDDFLLIPNIVPFSYLAFIHSDRSTRGTDLRNAIVAIDHSYKHLDIKGGSIHFFVENTSTGTIWTYGEGLPNGVFIQHLKKEDACWYRLNGNAPLEPILAGADGELGYDYFGLMLIDAKDNPRGLWYLCHFSIGPTIEDANGGFL